MIPKTSEDEFTKDKNFIVARVKFIKFSNNIIRIRCKYTQDDFDFDIRYKKFHKLPRLDSLLRNVFLSLNKSEKATFVENLFNIYYNTYTCYIRCSVKSNIVNDKEKILSGEFNFDFNFKQRILHLKRKLKILESQLVTETNFINLCKISDNQFLLKNEIQYLQTGIVNTYEMELYEDMPYTKISIMDSL
jgi:hypothetical protein